RPPAKAFANMKTIDAVERHQPHVGRIAPYLQRAAAHVRQGIAHHTVGVFWAACHVAKHAERREQKHGENASKPFEQTLHGSSALKHNRSASGKIPPGQGLQNSIFILVAVLGPQTLARSEEHSLNSSHVSISYAVFCLKKKRQ